MKFFFGAVAITVPTAFIWRLTERLQDDTLAMLMGGGLVGLVAIVILFVALRLLNSDRASERRAQRRDYAQAQPQAPVIIIQAAPQPRQIEQQQQRQRPARLEQRPHPSEYYGAPRRTVDSVGPVPRQITGGQWGQIGEGGSRL